MHIDFDVSKAKERFNIIEKRELPFAASSAINRTVFLISQRYLRKQMDRYFDGGATPFTKRGVRFGKSTKRNLTGAVYFMSDRPYLTTVSFGGEVKPLKSNTKLIQPVNQRVNKYGNIPRNTLGKKIARTDIYFFGKPKGQPNAQYGLYRRYKRKAPSLIIAYDKDSRTQKPIFPASRLSIKYAKRVFPGIFNIAFQNAVRTSRLQTPTGF